MGAMTATTQRTILVAPSVHRAWTGALKSLVPIRETHESNDRPVLSIEALMTTLVMP